MPRWPAVESPPGGEPPQSRPKPDAVGPVTDLEDGEGPMRRYPRIVTQPQRHRRAQQVHGLPGSPPASSGARIRRRSPIQAREPPAPAVATWEGGRAWPGSRPLRGRSCGTGGPEHAGVSRGKYHDRMLGSTITLPPALRIRKFSSWSSAAHCSRVSSYPPRSSSVARHQQPRYTVSASTRRSA